MVAFILQMYSRINAINLLVFHKMEHERNKFFFFVVILVSILYPVDMLFFLRIQTPPTPLLLLTLFGKAALHKLFSNKDTAYTAC